MPHTSDPVRFSHLRRIAQSPAHYLAGLESGIPDSARLRLGRAVDAILLEGPAPVCFDGTRRGREWDAFKAAHVGDGEILSPGEWETASRMVAAVRRRPDALRVLAGRRRVSIPWAYLGRACVSHPDVVGDEHVTDLKTGFTSHPMRFGNHAARMGYHAQLAFYREACIASGANDPKWCYLVVVESTPPYPVTVLRLSDRTLEKGRQLFHSWFETLLNCERSNAWPGYAEGVVEWDLPDEQELIFDDE